MHSIERYVLWEKPPGNWDVLNFSEVYPSDNEYGIPTIANDSSMPDQLIQWGSRPKLLEATNGSAVHFFLDDFRFESLWNNPERNLDALQRIGLALSPDFSLWRDMPVAMQIWNVYRNRWIGRYWQERGIKVIPTISWSEPYDFCYMGVEVGSIVAISSVGVVRADKEAHTLFRAGFDRMIEFIQPETILCYGSLAALNIETDIPIVTFPSRWQQRREVLYGR